MLRERALGVQLSERFNLVGIDSDRFEFILDRIKQSRMVWNAYGRAQHYIQLCNVFRSLAFSVSNDGVYQFPFRLIHWAGLQLSNANDYRLILFIGS
jgi:hypothetical protein